MVEFTTALAVLSLFLGWRLYVVSMKFRMAEMMLRGIIAGKVSITKTEDGIELEVKSNG